MTAYVFYTTFVLSILLIIGGFFVPTIGVIDGGVLTALGFLLLFATVEKIQEVVKAGRNLKIQKGDFEIEVANKGQE